MLFNRLKRGFPEVPAKDSDEVMEYAWEKNQIDRTGLPSEWAGDDDDDDDVVPFSASSARGGYSPVVIERMLASIG
jgi:hypothetical protein